MKPIPIPLRSSPSQREGATGRRAAAHQGAIGCSAGLRRATTRLSVFSLTLVLTLALALLVTGLFAAPAPAQAASDDFVFTGRGNGHGVGMSQWGAWYAARQGIGFADIVGFYYPGTELVPMDSIGFSADQTVTVLLSADPPGSSIVQFSKVDLKPTVTSATLVMSGQREAIADGQVVSLVNQAGKVQVNIGGEARGLHDSVELRSASGRVGLQTTPRGKTKAHNREVPAFREYWGTIRVQPRGAGLGTYNVVPVDKYVSGIGEVDLGWPNPKWTTEYALEAVKAQAVSSRSYALAKGGILTDGWADQYYYGWFLEGDSRYPGLARAAEETAGLVLAYDGKPINAYSSDHSGGYTTDSAWGGKYPPYIVAKPDPWSLGAPPTSLSTVGPGHPWTYTISQAALSKKFNVGTIERVEVIARDTADPESHARTIRITGDKGETDIPAGTFMSTLGLKSTLILSINGSKPEPLPPGEFPDVGPGHQYQGEIARMVTAGLMSGYPDGSYRPDGSITRWQFAKIAVNLYNLMHPDARIPLENVTVRPYDDVPVNSGVLGDESDWVAAAKQAGLITGVTSTKFEPYTILDRDEMAAMTCRALGWMKQAEALPPTTPGFTDVPYSESNPYWAPATYLLQKGIILGYPVASSPSGATELRVREPIRRDHVAVILCRVLDTAGR